MIRFSESIVNLTARESDWLTGALTALTIDPESPGFSCCLLQGGTELAISSEDDYGDPEAVALFVQEFLKTFRPDKHWVMTWSDQCGEDSIFGGGAVVVTAERYAVRGTGSLVDYIRHDESIFPGKKWGNPINVEAYP